MTTPRWRQIARTQSGIISRGQLTDSDVSPDRVDRMVAAGALVPVHRATMLVGGAPLTERARLWAAVLATGGILCGSTAGALWGLTDRPPTPVSVLVPHRRRVTRPHSVELRRWRDGQPPSCRREGLPVTRRSWTAIALLAELPRPEATRMADRALQRGWITRADLTERLCRFPHRRGNPQLRQLLDTIGDGAAAESERRLHRILRAHGFTGWRPNVPVWIDDVLVAVVDIAFRRAMVAIEVDGMAHHVDVDRFRRDRSRQNRLVTAGWTVLRFTWADLTENPEYVVRTIRAALTGFGESSPR